MKIRKFLCLVLSVMTGYSFVGCTENVGGNIKIMVIKESSNMTVVAPGHSLQLEVFEGTQKLSGVIFSVVSGPAGINALTGVLSCNPEASEGDIIVVRALLSGYTCEDFLVTVVAGTEPEIPEPPEPPIEPEINAPTAIAFVAPLATALVPGKHTLATVVSPAEANQEAIFSFAGNAPDGVTLMGNALAITSAAAHNASFAIKAAAGAKNTVTTTKTITVRNLPATPLESPWNVAPTIKSTFYDDFATGINSNNWRIENDKWGANNNGVRPANISYTSNREISAAFGAESGGVVVLQSNGDFMQTASRRREGANLVTRQAFGPGKYEARIKVLPRLGQCTALWTYWRGNAGNGIPYDRYEEIKYSEIDIELPLWADYRNISGVSYQYYSDSWDWATQVNNRREVVNIENKSIPALNDGQWHTFAFDWRTDAANGDRGVIWYVDGMEFGRKSTWIPEYTATFNIANWFPQEVPWIGDPTFETAYMYIDWVKITQYNDPTKTGSTGVSSSGTATNLGSNPIPLTNYISNGKFEQELTVQNTRNQSITSWTRAAGTLTKFDAPSRLNLAASSKATQPIGGQYAGYTFSLDVEAAVTSGDGKCKAYVEFCSGNAATQNPTLSVRGKSRAIEFVAGDRAWQNLIFTVTGSDVNHIRVVIETEAGTTASVYEVKMFLL